MSNSSKSVLETENEWFPSTLRGFMARHPVTGEITTQKALADFLDVRPQTLSLYCNGQTQPTPAKLLKIAEYFDVTTDFLLTGKRVENKPVREMLGLSEDTVQRMKLVKEGYFEDSPHLLDILDVLLADKDFYETLAKAAQNYDDKLKAQAGKQCPDCGSLLANNSPNLDEYYEWRTTYAIQDFFLSFFRQDFIGIHSSLKKGDGE